MKEYILNKTPVMTTNGFKINDIKIKLDIPNINSFNKYIYNDNHNIIKEDINGKDLKTNLGLSFNKSYILNITIPKNTKINNSIELTYNFNNNDILIDNITIIYEENSSANIFFKYNSLDKEKHIHMFKENIITKDNSSGSITIINSLNEFSYHFIEIDGTINNNSNITHNIFDIGSDIKLENINLDLKEKATHYLNSIYIGSNDGITDINYYIKNIGKNSCSNINVEGLLKNNAKKHFKGTIDFIKGSTESIGKEHENVILLSNTCISKSLPMLLCHEENVIGEHGVSSGKIDEDKLFYLMTRGYSKKDAENLIISTNFNKIINTLPNDKIKEEISNLIDKYI